MPSLNSGILLPTNRYDECLLHARHTPAVSDPMMSEKSGWRSRFVWEEINFPNAHRMKKLLKERVTGLWKCRQEGLAGDPGRLL